MTANRLGYNFKQKIIERNEALLSMDRDKILAFAHKYSGNNGYADEDEYIFWISVHKMRTASTSLPVNERLLSVQWLTERGFEHWASDLFDNPRGRIRIISVNGATRSETCTSCGFNLLIPTGTCSTCPMCGSSSGCS